MDNKTPMRSNRYRMGVLYFILRSRRLWKYS